MKLSLLTLSVVIAVVTAVKQYELSDIVSARIETCRGCSLNRMPEVKKFVMEDAPLYKRLQVKFISGAPPELILMGIENNVLDRIPLSGLDREECNELMEDNGFEKRTDKHEF